MTFPPSWDVLPLEDCLSAIIDYRGKTPAKTSAGIPLVTAKIVKGGRIEEPNEFIAEEDYESWMTRGHPEPGDVVITTEAPLGEVAQLDDQRIALAQRIILLRGDPQRLDNSYLKYSIISEYVQSQLRARSSGTTVLGIKQSELRKVKIALPSLGEQKRIANTLRALDDKIEINRRMNTTLEQIIQALFKSWFIDYEPVKAKASGLMPDGIDSETFALFPDELVEECNSLIPKGWLCKELADVIEINPQRKLPKGQVATYLDMSNVPTAGHRPTGWTQREMGSGMKFINGDTLLARITPCLENGKTAFVDFLADGEIGWGSTEFIILRPKQGLPDYFAYLLCRHNDFRAYAIQSMTGTSGRQRVQADQLGKYKIAVPPPQSPIGAKFGDLIMPLVKKISQNSEEAQRLADLRDTLLPRLISGQLPVPDIEQGGV